MNQELIKSLYIKAVDYCVEQGPNPDGTNKAWTWEEKFTELIVNECANTCLTMAYVNPEPHHYAAMLKEHFGVE